MRLSQLQKNPNIKDLETLKNDMYWPIKSDGTGSRIKQCFAAPKCKDLNPNRTKRTAYGAVEHSSNSFFPDASRDGN
jgi:hypothetical protein